MTLTAETIGEDPQPDRYRNRSVYMRAEYGCLELLRLARPCRIAGH